MNTGLYVILFLCVLVVACGGDPMLERGTDLLEKGDFAAAIVQFETLLRQDSANVAARYQLGLAYELSGDLMAAGEAFRGAAKLDPERADILLAVGRIHWHSGERSDARLAFQRVLAGNPKPEVLLQLAGLTGDAYAVERLRTEGSDDYEQTFTEKGNMMTFTAKYTDDYSPAISPDGASVAFASNRLQNAELYLMDLQTRRLQQLTHTDELDEYMPAFSPDGGSMAFVTERTRGGMMLPPVQASGSDPKDATIYLMAVDGQNQRPLIDIAGAQRAPVFSPDGKRIAFESRAEGESTPGSGADDDTLEVFVIDVDGKNRRQLTENTVDDGHPSWSSDGKRIVFTGMVDNIYQIFTVPAAGGTVRQLTFRNASHYHPTFSADGKRIVYVSNAYNHYTLWMMDNDGKNRVQLTGNVGAHFEPSLTADGKRLVFSSDRSDHMRIYLMDLRKPVGKGVLAARIADM